MCILIAFSVYFFAVAGTANYVQDTLSLGTLFYQSKLSQFEGTWFAPKAATWSNKYKLINGARKRSHGERWPTSSTATVFVTDGWHFFQFLTFTHMTLGAITTFSACLYFSTPMQSAIISLLADKVIKGLFFELTKRVTT